MPVQFNQASFSTLFSTVFIKKQAGRLGTHLTTCLSNAGSFFKKIYDLFISCVKTPPPSFKRYATSQPMTLAEKNFYNPNVLGIVLQNLPLQDLNNLTLASKSFYKETSPFYFLELVQTKSCSLEKKLKYLPLVGEQVKSLDFSNNRLLSVEQIEAIVKHCPNLKSITLKTNDEGLRSISKLVNLETLDLYDSDLTDAGLQHLATLNLKSLNLSRCFSLTDAGLQHLAPLINLESLNLSYCSKVTDLGLQHLAPLINLESLNLSYCSKVTDLGLQRLAPLINLESLNLSYCSKVTDLGLQRLATFAISLKTLNLLDCYHVTDAGLQHLTALIKLKNFESSKCAITDDGLKHLATLDLETLRLSSCPTLTGLGLQYLATFATSLKTLNLSDCSITDENLKYASIFSNLETIDLSSCPTLTGAAISHLPALLNLKALNLSNGVGCSHYLIKLKNKELNLHGCLELTEADLQKLLDISANLEKLNFSSCDNISEKNFQQLAALNNLKTLGLSQTPLTSTGLQHLTTLINLTELDLSDNKTTLKDEDLRYLAPFTKLEKLNLSCNPQLTEAGFKHLAPLSAKLKTLRLFACYQVKNEHVNYIADTLTNLKSLDLTNCELLTRNGFQHLNRLEHLKTISLDTKTRSKIEGIFKNEKITIKEGIFCKNFF